MQSIPKIDFLKKSSQQIEGFEWVDFGDLLQQASLPKDHSPFQFHRLQFNIILMIVEGEVDHKVDMETHRVKAGDCLLIFSNQIHAFDPQSLYKGGLILATDAFLQQHISPALMRYIHHHHRFPPNKKPIHAPKLCGNLLSALRNDQWKNPLLQKEYIGASLTLFYTQLLNLTSESNANDHLKGEYKLFNQFYHLIQKYSTQSRDANWYAAQLGITYKHLNVICKEFIDQYIMLEAKRYLLSSQSSIKEISYQLGFDEPTNFQKYFKRHSKLTPRSFREQYI